MKDIIKKSYIGKCMYYLRDLYRFPNMLTIENKIKNRKNSILLIGTPTFNNLGDHLIAVAEIQFLRDIYHDHEIIEIPTQVFNRYRNKIVQLVDKSSLIFITGGGWMGSIWPDDEYQMQSIINAFSMNKITILPQTVFYNFNDKNAKKVFDSAINTYKKCKKLSIYFRDQASFEFGKKYFTLNNVSVHLVPDIALYYKSADAVVKKKGITLCFRGDREKIVDLDIKKIVTKFATKNNFKVYYTDTVQIHSIPIWYRKKKIEKKSKEFSQSRLIITDRLHGMIFSVITGTKCIAFDNKTNKVRGVYEKWLRGNNNILFMTKETTEKELIEAINNLLGDVKKNNIWKNKINEQFEIMKCELEET